MSLPSLLQTARSATIRTLEYCHLRKMAGVYLEEKVHLEQLPRQMRCSRQDMTT